MKEVGTKRIIEILAFGTDVEVDNEDTHVRVECRVDQQGVYIGADKQEMKEIEEDSVPKFMLFTCSHGIDESIVRASIAATHGECALYGGAAYALAPQPGAIWSVLHNGSIFDSNSDKAVFTTSVCGVRVSFLLSAVVKNWAKPRYAQALEYLLPKYTGNAEDDLLTAIKFDDWDKFTECIEDKGVSVNFKWTNKLNQSPLLAAASRAGMNMVTYLIERGADVDYANDGGYDAYKYTLKLKDIGPEVVDRQMNILRAAGAKAVL